MNDNPRVFADERGVWIAAEPGEPYGSEWEEIVAIGGYKLDLQFEVQTVVELEHASGEVLELRPAQRGFEAVAAAMAQRLPGLGGSWLAQIESLSPDDAPLRVWQRP